VQAFFGHDHKAGRAVDRLVGDQRAEPGPAIDREIASVLVIDALELGQHHQVRGRRSFGQPVRLGLRAERISGQKQAQRRENDCFHGRH